MGRLRKPTNEGFNTNTRTDSDNLAYVPVMIAADFIRGFVANGGDEPEWKKRWKASDYLADGVQRAGLLGIPQFGIDAAKWGPAELAGPAVGQGMKAVKNFEKGVKKDYALDEKKPGSKEAEDFTWDGYGLKKTLKDALPRTPTRKFTEREIDPLTQ